MQRRIWFFQFLILSLLALGSCKNSKLSKLAETQGAFLGKVVVSAGDDIDYSKGDTLNFMAFPMNVLNMEEKRPSGKRIYLIGKSIPKNSLVAFKPVALLNVKRESETEKIVIATPIDETLQTASISTFFELLSVQYGVQKVIETWETNVYGYGRKIELSWDNEEKAEDYLEGSLTE